MSTELTLINVNFFLDSYKNEFNNTCIHTFIMRCTRKLTTNDPAAFAEVQIYFATVKYLSFRN